MEIVQVHDLVNNALRETLGEENLLEENLANVVDIGTAVFNGQAFDAYVRTLVNHIGKVIFVNRPYRGSAPSVLMDAWEYGSVVEKIQGELPVATENESWKLQDGASYDPNVFHRPAASAKFFNKKTTFEIDASITEMQVRQSFSSATQLNAFVSMIFNEIEKSLTVANDNLIMRTIGNMFAETLKDGNGNRAVNLLTMYNARFPNNQVTVNNAIYTPEFIRFAAYQMGLYTDRLTRISKLFNVGGKARFTPKELQHIVMLSEFAAAADVYLQSDTFHDEYTKLVNAERVPFWQGSGENYEFAATSGINYIPASGGDAKNQSGILACIFDRDALGVMNYNARVTTQYNAKAEFTNYFYKKDASYFNDLDENFVMFYIGA